MKVFLSWSGERSKEVALQFKKWLPIVLHGIEPWLSEADISAGDRWGKEVSEKLENNNFGIICLTKQNLTAPWILFESGALSKSLASSSVCPYLIDINASELPAPLSQFQAKKFDKTQTFDLIKSLNEKQENPDTLDRIETLFEMAWPRFETPILEILNSGTEIKSIPNPKLDQQELLDNLFLQIKNLEFRLNELAEKQNAKLGLIQEIVSLSYEDQRRRFQFNPKGITQKSARSDSGLEWPLQPFKIKLLIEDSDNGILKSEILSTQGDFKTFINHLTTRYNLELKSYGLLWYFTSLNNKDTIIGLNELEFIINRSDTELRLYIKRSSPPNTV